MSALAEHLIERIRERGPLPVSEYMRLCLFHPAHGYYRTRSPIGAAGDFITAPEVSQMFGELVGLWAAALWQMLGRPSAVRLVELGPGRGTLMSDALRAVAKTAPDFRAALDVHLVEVSPVLRRQQAKALAAGAPRWHDDIASIPAGPAIVIANEFFDALSVRQAVRVGSDWRERVVDHVDGRFVFAAGAPTEPPSATSTAAAQGAIREWSPDRDAYAHRLARRIADHGGAALVIDYGALAIGGDTLQAVRAQQKVDPLAEPGLADLTSHVDFSALASAARSAAGVDVHGPVPQGAWLRRLGIAARAATLLRTASPAQACDIEAAMRRLIEPDEMGTLFNVLAIVPHGLPVPPGFDA